MAARTKSKVTLGIARFSASLDPEWLEEALEGKETASIRRRKLPASPVVWLVLGMALFADRSIVEVVEHLGLVLPGVKTLSAGALPQASVASRAGRRVRRVRRVQTLGGRQVALPPRTASCDRYSLNAGISVKAEDRAGLGRLARYMLRPPLSKERLERKADGTVVIGLKRVWSDGTSEIALSAAELAEKLAALFPPPRAKPIMYRGVLAANAAWRTEVIPKPPADRRAARGAVKFARGPRINEGSERVPWAGIIKRILKVDAFACGLCGGQMVLRCVVVGVAAARLLAGLKRATGPPE